MNIRFLMRVLRLSLLCAIALVAANSAAPAQGPLDFLKSEKSAKYDLDPAAADQLVGVVVDEDDRPVEGATVYLRLNKQWNKPPQKVTTDDRGQFTFSDLESGKLQLMAFKGASASRTQRRKWEEISFETVLSKEPTVVTLVEARSLKIQVLAERDSSPIQDAEVSLRYVDIPAKGQTDEEGIIQLGGLCDHAITVTVRADGYAIAKSGVNLKRAGQADVTLRLKPGAVLTGRLTDLHGEPIERAYIALRDASDPSSPFCDARTDADGRYTMPHAPAGIAYRLDFGRDGFLDLDVSRPPLAVSSEPVIYNVTLARRPYGGAVTGIVIDSEGKPMAGAEVQNWGRSSSDKKITYTNTEGRFEIYDVFGKELGRYEVIVKAAGHVGQVVPFEPGTEEKPDEIEITLKAGHTLTGRVVNEAGDPIKGAYVKFGEQYWSFGESIRSGEKGEFAFDSLPEDTEIEVNARGYSEFKDKLPLDSDDVVNVVLLPKGVLRGIAIDDKTEQPITNFNVRITFSPERKPGEPSSGISSELVNPGQKHSSPKGWFDIDNLTVDQPFMVIVEADGYRPATLRRVVAVRTSQADRATLRLTPIDKESLTNIAGQIAYADGKPLVGAEVRLVASQTGKTSYGREIGWSVLRGEVETNDHIIQHIRTSTDVDGRFAFSGVYSDLELELAYFGGNVAPKRVLNLEKLPAEEQGEMHLVAQLGAKLVITTDSTSFPPVRSVNLMSTNDPRSYDPSLRLWRPQNDGSWQIEGIAPGEYKLTVSKAIGKNKYGGTMQEPVYRETLNFTEGETKTLLLTQPQEDTQ